MTLDEGVTVVLMVGVGVLTTAALYVGLVGMLGGFYIVRCASCSHWTFSRRPAAAFLSALPPSGAPASTACHP